MYTDNFLLMISYLFVWPSLKRGFGGCDGLGGLGGFNGLGGFGGFDGLGDKNKNKMTKDKNI